MNRVTFTWFHPQKTATAANPAVYDMRESMTTGTGMRATAYFTSEDSVYAEISSHPGGVALDLVGVQKPDDVKIEAFLTAGCRKSYNTKTQTVRVQCRDNVGGVKIQISGVKESRNLD